MHLQNKSNSSEKSELQGVSESQPDRSTELLQLMMKYQRRIFATSTPWSRLDLMQRTYCRKQA